jgi:transcriptional regulator with GAF, ATPase, and Fis domain
MSQPQSAHVSRSLVEAFREMAAHVHSSEDYEDTYGRISATAVQTIKGCDAASISLIEETGPVSHGITDSLAQRGDLIQYETREGPCLDAAMAERWIYTPDMAAADRWPMSSRRLVDELGVRSMFSCRLALDAAPNHTLGGLNLYSRGPEAFSEEDQLLAILLSSLGAVVVDASRQQAQLRAAIESRQVIGEAVGILRAQGNVSSDEAFQMLAKASMRMNVKLRDLARQISDGSRNGRALKNP